MACGRETIAMKSKKNQRTDVDQCQVGLAALGVAGAWEVAIDEAVEGTQRWFAQIEGPAFYIYFQIQHPRVIDEMVTFLKRHLCPDKCLQRSASAPDSGADLELSHFGESAVSLIWDSETHQRFIVIMSGKN